MVVASTQTCWRDAAMAGMVRLEDANGTKYRMRPDLEICRWDAGDDGQPRWLIRDPVTEILDLLSWPESIMLPGLLKGMSVAELRRLVERQSTLRPDDADVLDFVKRLGGRGWLAGGAFWPNAGVRGRENRAMWLFSHYLYWRVTLWRPDAFLNRTLPLVRKLGSRCVVIAVLLLAVLGAYLTFPRWEEFLATATRLANWRNLPWILPAVVLVKLAHELGHAYAAKAGGARVDGMGVALVMLLPLPFVNVTDAWRLPGKRRFQVAAAGVMVEAAIAGLSLPAWAMAPPGRGKDLCLVFATTALASTLATNLNPGVRFDGYYMLSHLLGVENLRARASGLLIHGWRRIFWGMKTPDPEPALGIRKRCGMAAYAVFAWFYRLALFSGIALAVYRMFPKVFGIAMFATVWWSFALLPGFREMKALWTRRRIMGWRAGITCLVFLAAAAWLTLELPRRSALPAVIRGRESLLVSAVTGEILFADAEEGAPVVKGQTFARVRRMETEAGRIGAQWSAEEARMVAGTSWLSESGRALLMAREARAEAALMAQRVWQTREDLSIVSASADGILETWEPWVRKGTYVSRGTVLGRVRHPGASQIFSLVDVAAAKRYEPGQSARFFSASGGDWLEGTIVRIEPHRIDSLDDGILARLADGKWDGRTWRLSRPMNRIVVVLESDYRFNGQEGTVWITTKPYSLAREAWKWVSGLVMRESGT